MPRSRASPAAASLPARPGLRAPSSALLLAAVWLAVVVYASLFPFAGWRWPGSMSGWELLALRWPRYFIPFDIGSNVGGYLPLGLLLTVGLLRQGLSGWAAFSLAVLLGAGTSYLMEVLQHLLPPRVPSLLDWALNAGGTVLGALLALLLRALGALRHWQAVRERWFERGSAGALALLLLWPVALLFPQAVPLGLGQVAGPLTDGLVAALADVPWADDARQALLLSEADNDSGLSPVGQYVGVALGMAAPLLLASAATHRGWQRLALMALVAGLGLGGTALSTALNFGPEHAFAGFTPPALLAMGVGAGVAAALAGVGARVAAGLALMALTGLVLLVNDASTDPYLALSLQGWEQGRFIRFHGLAQWLGWLWPYAAMAWLLARLARRSSR